MNAYTDSIQLEKIFLFKILFWYYIIIILFFTVLQLKNALQNLVSKNGLDF